MSTTTIFPAGIFRPAPERGRKAPMLIRQTLLETKLALRNGEQLLLTLLIPLVLLLGFTHLQLISSQDNGINAVTPRILALAIMSSAFTGQAIALGFDRRYGVVKRLAATSIPRWLIGAGRLLSTCIVGLIQLVVLGTAAALSGWSPSIPGIAPAVLVLMLGIASFGCLGALLGGTLRADIVLAVANLLWLALLLIGGIAVSLSALPGWLAEIARLLPSGALTEALTDTLVNGTFPHWPPLLGLTAWAAAAGILASKTFRLT